MPVFARAHGAESASDPNGRIRYIERAPGDSGPLSIRHQDMRFSDLPPLRRLRRRGDGRLLDDSDQAFRRPGAAYQDGTPSRLR